MKKQVPKIYAILCVFRAHALWVTGKTLSAEKGGTLELAFVT